MVVVKLHLQQINIILHKYIGYYLLFNQKIINNIARGIAQKKI